MKKRSYFLLNIFFMIGTLFMVVLDIQKGHYAHIQTDLLFFVLLSLPYFLEKFQKKKIDLFFKTLYLLFLFITDLLGCVFRFYNLIPWYDLFAHFFSGILLSFLACYFFSSFYVSKKKISKWIFVLSFVVFISFVWEVFEFAVDITMKTNLQHSFDSGVRDTMEDMLIALLGGFLFLGLSSWNQKK